MTAIRPCNACIFQESSTAQDPASARRLTRTWGALSTRWLAYRMNDIPAVIGPVQLRKPSRSNVVCVVVVDA